MHTSTTQARLDYLAVGHVTSDVGLGGSATLGGAVSYAAVTAAALGMRTGIVTRAAPGYPPAGALPGVEHHVVTTRATTTFENRYDRHGARTQRLLALATPIDPGDVPPLWRRVGVLHLAPVVHEIGPEWVSSVQAAFVGLTPQGWLRRLAEGELVTPQPWSVPPGLLELADAVVLSEEDLAADPDRIPWLVDRTRVLVLTHGAEGARAYFDGRVVTQAALPAEVVDPTGAGDVFAAAFFTRLREGSDVPEALRFAAAAAACNVEAHGLAGVPDRAAVAKRAGVPS